jgi:molybdenum cofactor biosynthesis enzyme MoaA
MKDNIINTLKRQFEANINKHKLNIDVMLNNPIAIHDHTDFMGAIEKELEQISEYEDKLEALTKHFIK